ncbi:hypothetical protein [Mycetocola saprophilus]|uniref:hypothetical protein n=1 Tax=Mycetocola saprophilus TaxID=76636 RepID=UPI0004C16104|nr:hypothetical protein [Mycetocola saprophilus]
MNSTRIAPAALAGAARILEVVTLDVDPLPTIGPTEEAGILIEMFDGTQIRSAEILSSGEIELFHMRVDDAGGTHLKTRDSESAARFLIGRS